MGNTDLAHRAPYWLEINPVTQVVFHSQRFITDDAILGTHSGWRDDPVFTPIGRVLEHKCQVFDELVVPQRWIRRLVLY